MKMEDGAASQRRGVTKHPVAETTRLPGSWGRAPVIV